jgi:hypothetical protein
MVGEKWIRGQSGVSAPATDPWPKFLDRDAIEDGLAETGCVFNI